MAYDCAKTLALTERAACPDRHRGLKSASRANCGPTGVYSRAAASQQTSKSPGVAAHASPPLSKMLRTTAVTPSFSLHGMKVISRAPVLKDLVTIRAAATPRRTPAEATSSPSSFLIPTTPHLERGLQPPVDAGNNRGWLKSRLSRVCLRYRERPAYERSRRSQEIVALVGIRTDPA